MVFEGFVVPDPLLLAPLVGIAFVLLALLYSVRPPVRTREVLAFLPWIVLGSLLHVIYQMDVALGGSLLPAPVDVLFSAPSVYLTTFIFLALVWVFSAMIASSADQSRRIAVRVGGTGAFALALVAAFAGWTAIQNFQVAPILPIFGLVASMGIAFVLYILIGLWRAYIIANAGYVGGLVLFAHIFDGITTAIGIELLDAAERSTAPQAILDVAADLPTADTLPDVWLFVAVKITLAIAIVVLFHSYVEEHPSEGHLFLAGIIAVGLGPATHNFLLFAFGVGA